MESEAAPSSGRWAGDGARILGRAVLAGGFAMGLMFGLGWWLLADNLANRAPVGELTLPRSGPSAPLLPIPAPSGAVASQVVPAPPLPTAAPSTSPPHVPATGGPAAQAGTTSPGRPTLPARSVVVLTARYATTSAWDSGYIGKITVTNVSDGPQSYEVRVQLPAGVSVTDAWSNTASSAGAVDRGGLVTFTGGPVGARGTVVVGFQAAKNPALTSPRQFEPTSCTVDGAACG